MLYLIVAVILSTIAIQVYWNYKNYQTNKQQLINEVRHSLNTSVESYFADLAQTRTFSIISDSMIEPSYVIDTIKKANGAHQIKLSQNVHRSPDKINGVIDSGRVLYGVQGSDTIFERFNLDSDSIKLNLRTLRSFEYETDSIQLTQIGELRSLTSKIVISLSHDSLRLKSIDSLFSEELKTRNIDVQFELSYSFNEFLRHRHGQDSVHVEQGNISLNATSPFLPPHTTLTVTFSNSTSELFKRSLLGISISTLLILAVIGCLFYLLRIIKHQKQLAEIKNDLISNITHEFKTPIATIGVAVEGIRNFDVLDDKEKTKSYLDMSKQQLDKLNTMVEKLLETATLDSESLSLHKSENDIIALIKAVVEKHQIVKGDKSIKVELINHPIEISIDEFHIENAINTILDNAIKYGGEDIQVSVKDLGKTVVIDISDNGNTLRKGDKDKIFEKFYRIPKGNTHDVKGFGIGLYYAKKVIEKHGGSLNLSLTKHLTTFSITLPHG